MKDSIKPVVRIGRSVVPTVFFSKPTSPSMRSFVVKPSLKVGRTQVQIEDQGYTYNQAGFIYNQIGWEYGGLFKHDIYPLISRARIEKPSVMIGGDFGARVYIPPGANTGMLIGMLGMTYP